MHYNKIFLLSNEIWECSFEGSKSQDSKAKEERVKVNL